MTRELPGLPSGGFPVGPSNVVLIPFPDIAKPVDGDWVLKASVRRTTSSSATVKMQLVQPWAGLVIASKTQAVSNTYSTVELTISQPELDKVIRGRCHVANLHVRLIDASCCDPMEMGDKSVIVRFVVYQGSCPAINNLEIPVRINGGVGTHELSNGNTLGVEIVVDVTLSPCTTWPVGSVKVYCNNSLTSNLPFGCRRIPEDLPMRFDDVGNQACLSGVCNPGTKIELQVLPAT